MSVVIRSDCRGCGGPLSDFLSLGNQPLANALIALDAPDAPTFPLTLARCTSCGLVQLREVVDPAVLFADYAYVPSTSSTMRAHFDELAGSMVARLGLESGDLVVDVGSNDGLLLSGFQRRGMRVQGIEPAENLARLAEAHGIPTLVAFFNADVARGLARTTRAALVTATNVFAHVDDVRGFMRAAFELLAPDGVFLVEVQSFADTVSALAFDMTYHEHMTYYATAPLARMCAAEGLELLDVERVATHGGSLRALIGRAGHPLARPDRVAARVAEEGTRAAAEGCRTLAEGAAVVREELPRLLRSLRAQGARVAAYGAPAKATVLLNYCGLTTDDVQFVVDKNVAKQNRLVPGVRIPVVGPERLLEDPPTHLLVLAWNLLDEIIREQATFREQGGAFIAPVPHPLVMV
ncbi:MAG: class I SAM-dependent methyltransferase [Gemmatimonas sp.]